MSKIFILSLLVCLWLAPAAHAQLTAAEMREKATADESEPPRRKCSARSWSTCRVKRCAPFK